MGPTCLVAVAEVAKPSLQMDAMQTLSGARLTGLALQCVLLLRLVVSAGSNSVRTNEPLTSFLLDKISRPGAIIPNRTRSQS